jgi:hypothetical protein
MFVEQNGRQLHLTIDFEPTAPTLSAGGERGKLIFASE